MSNMTFVPPPKEKVPTLSSLKITKIGLLSRKEDLAEGGKKAASRKWKGWSVVLTGSQLLFFVRSYSLSSPAELTFRLLAMSRRTPTGPTYCSRLSLQPLLPSLDLTTTTFSSSPSRRRSSPTPFSRSPTRPPSTTRCALHDYLELIDTKLTLTHRHQTDILQTYAKYSNVFRLVAPAGRQYLFQAQTPADLNSWLHAINYAASFKSANLRMRSLTPKPRSSDPPPTSPPASPLPPALPTPQSPQPQAWGTLGSLGSSTSSTATNGSTAPVDDATAPPTAPHHNLSPVSEENPALPASLREALRAEEDEKRKETSGEGDPVVALAGLARKDGAEVEHEENAGARSSPGPGQEAFKPLGPTRAELLRASFVLYNEKTSFR